jgi:hypothetical protein
MDYDYYSWYQSMPSSATVCMHLQEALDFVTTPSVLVTTPLLDVTNKKSYKTQ